MNLIKQLDHLNLSVSNLEQSLRWYKDIFGFEVVERAIQDGVPWAIIRAGEAMLCIYEQPDKVFVDRRNREIQGMNHFALRITDKQQWLEIVQHNELEILYGEQTDWTHSTSWYVRDPTGYEIEVALWKHDTINFGK